ncbi:DUF2306 domain-containing protein [uncultured Corynebacterium sp.]|uniref:DUF2306 domain-containing protein n=1 Tax=uncultured Corynebacterium sp. TaxID=159447 RepID=UPI0025DD6D74|nr:DUF2306 domain-containing protein [uncultured Corynebacterium sp.]
MDTFTVPILVHVTAAFLVLVLGPVNIFRPRRDQVHRMLGRTWVLLMYVNCGASFFFGLEDGFGFLHFLSIFTAVAVTVGVVHIRRGNVSAHRGCMVGSYIGTLIAFGFAALVPERLIWTTATADPMTVVVFAGSLIAVAAAWVIVLKMRWPAAPSTTP